MLTIKKVLEEFKDADKIELADGNILTVSHNDGFIGYCKEPEKLFIYAQQGHIIEKFRKNCWNHTDYYFV